MRQLEQQMTVSGNSPHTLSFPETAAQTFEVGAPVVLAAAGTVQEAVSPITSLVGVAAANASGVTGRICPVWIANDDTLFGVVMPGGVQADIGKTVDVKKTGALWTADRTITTGKFLVMEIGQSLPPGQVIARGKFLESATQLAKTA
jgi:hypothetical protein